MYLKLNDVMPDGTGIFDKLDGIGMPWVHDPAHIMLDIMYEGRSFDKLISPVVTKRLNSEEKLTDAALNTLAHVIWSIYQDKWSHIWETLQMEYDPLSNYDMIEEGEDETKKTGTDTNVKTGSRDNSGAITRTGSQRTQGDVKRTGSEEDAGNASDNTGTDSVYGFNSSNAVPSDVSTSSHKNTKTYNNVNDNTDTTTTFNSLADTDTRKETYNNIQDQLTHNTTDKLTHQLTRKGNIGVTTSQQMAESEISLRSWIYFENVMKDIDSILTLPLY